MKRKGILTAVLLTFALTLWGQGGLRIVDPDSTITPERVIAQITLCIPIVDANDTTITLICSGIEVEIPVEQFIGELTIVIHPNDKDGPITSKKTVNWYLPPKSEYNKYTLLDGKWIEN